MKNMSKNLVSACAILMMPLVHVSALMVPQSQTITKIMSKLPNNLAGVHARRSSSALNFHNPNMDHLDGYHSHYKARESAISLGNRFRTVPKPYYDSNFQHKPARPLSTPPLARSTPSSSTAAASSPDYSEYSTQNVYWSDVNGFPQDVVDPQAMPPMDDLRNAAVGNNNNNNGPMNDDRIYSPDKYYQNDPNPSSASSASSSSRFQDIPFQSNENYAKKFYRNAEHERQGPGGHNDYGMNSDFGNRPMDRPYNPDMMRSGEMNMGGGGRGGYGYDNMHPAPGMEQNDFPSLMNEIMPPPGGGGRHMQSMSDPYAYGQGYGGYEQHGGMGMGGGMMGGMGGAGMDMPPPRGDWGFQEMGMGPGGEQWGRQEWGYGGPPPGGDFFGGQQEWGVPHGGGGGGQEPFGGEPFGGPGGFW